MGCARDSPVPADSATGIVRSEQAFVRSHCSRTRFVEYVFTPPQPRVLRSAVVLFHGGGWTDGSPDWVFAAAVQFAASGILAIPVAYRLAARAHGNRGVFAC